MRRLFLLVSTLGALACATPVLAQTACATASDDSAVPVESGATNPSAMASTIIVGALLADDVSGKVSRDVGCNRAEFAVANLRYRITGENGDPSPRRIVPVGNAQAPLFYLATIPDLGLSGEGGPKAKVALVSVDARAAIAWRFYTGIPADAMLRRDVSLVFANGLRPMAAMQRGTRQLQIMTDAGGPPEPKSSVEADGTVFVKQGENDGRHAATGFVCRGSVAEVLRRDFTIYDPPKGRDVSCGYGIPNERTWFTVYLTEIPGETHRDIFNGYVQSAKGAAPGARNVRSPVDTGRAPRPTDAAFWQGGPNRNEGLVLSSIGDWRVKVRISYAPGDEAVVERLVKAIYEQAYAEVRP